MYIDEGSRWASVLRFLADIHPRLLFACFCFFFFWKQWAWSGERMNAPTNNGAASFCLCSWVVVVSENQCIRRVVAWDSGGGERRRARPDTIFACCRVCGWGLVGAYERRKDTDLTEESDDAFFLWSVKKDLLAASGTRIDYLKNELFLLTY